MKKLRVGEIQSRVIGIYEGKRKGPLFICVGGMHGNEPAGVLAIREVLKMLEVEPLGNPTFRYAGQFVGLIGNMAALTAQSRFINKDLNRQFQRENILRLKSGAHREYAVEDREMLALLQEINRLVAKYRPEKIVFMDIHTTTVSGGIFAIVPEDEEAIRIACSLHVPIVRGMLEGIQGTTLHFFNKEHYGMNITSFALEAGQHQDPFAVNIAISGIIATMRAIGAVKPHDVEGLHDRVLKEYSRNLPRMTRLAYVYRITEDDQFRMYPGYLNFHRVVKGEILGINKDGPVTAPVSGYILMPLYQKQGEDGFFIIQQTENTCVQYERQVDVSSEMENRA